MDAGRDDVSAAACGNQDAPDYRPEFLAALDLLARASALMLAEGRSPPVLVGGAVVEFDTLGAITSGDLDLVSADQLALERALEAVGFRREDRPGRRLGGYFHPDIPIGVDCVSSRYYDGLGDRTRIRLIGMPSGEVMMAPIEEIIIDRYGQWEASDRRDRDMADQLRALMALALHLDETYVKRRILQDTGSEPDFAALTNPGPTEGDTP